MSEIALQIELIDENEDSMKSGLLLRDSSMKLVPARNRSWEILP